MDRIYEETKFLMKKYGITANKKLGQNFLIDENVIDTIANASELTEEDLVIEIGPGLGTLTAKLLEKAGKVICIELDDRMISILKDRFFINLTATSHLKRINNFFHQIASVQVFPDCLKKLSFVPIKIHVRSKHCN